MLRDLVKAVDEAPSDALRDGGKAGVGKQVENLTGDLGGNDPRVVGVGHVFGGWFVVDGKLAAGDFAAERASEGVGAGKAGIMFGEVCEAVEASHVDRKSTRLNSSH